VQNNSTGIKTKQGSVAKLLAALMLGYLLTLLGNLIMWQLTSYKNVRAKLDHEYNQYLIHREKYEASLLSRIGFDSQRYQATVSYKIQGMKARLNYLLSEQNTQSIKDTKNTKNTKSTKSTKDTDSTKNTKIIDDSVNAIYSFLTIVYLTMKVILAKLLAVLGAIGLYIFTSMLGLLDGLVARYKRTMQAGRESTFVFHRVAKLLLSSPVLLMFIYIISPFYINPLIINFAIAGFLFSGFRVYGSNLKKYM